MITAKTFKEDDTQVSVRETDVIGLVGIFGD